MSEARVPLGERLNAREKQVLILTLVLALFVSSITQQIVAVATPRLLADLGGFSLLSWVFTSYMLASTIVIPIVGKLSDTFGRKPFLLGGVVLFVVGSVGCAAAVSMPMLIAARLFQGAGSGFVTATVMATVADLFPPAERGKYMAFFFSAGSIAQLSGPTFGGFLTDTLGWRWCFLISLPIAVISLWVTATRLPSEKREAGPLRLDVTGSALLTVATTSLLLGLAWARQEYGWGAPATVGLFALAVVVFTGFFFQERRHPNPIVPLHLFRDRTFTLGAAITALLSGATIGGSTYLPTFVQVALGTTATASGLITTPQAISSLIASFIAGQFMARTGRYRVQMFIGLALMLAAAVALSTLGIGDPEWHVSLYAAVLGLGSTTLTTTLGVVIVNAVPQTAIGVASGVRGFSMQIGSVLGVAVLGAVLSSSYVHSFGNELPVEAKAGIDPAVVAEFDDPTITLDERRFAAVQAELEGVPGGEAFLTAAQGAQREGIAEANKHVYFVITALVLLAIALTVILPETPLRKTFSEPAKPPEGAASEGVPVPGALQPAVVETRREP